MENKDIVILTTEGCDACEDLKNSRITNENGNVIKPEFLDIQTSDDAVDIVLNQNVEEVPMAFTKSDKGFNKCSIKYDEEKGEAVVICEH